jgi:hypothetical protein
MRSTSHVNLLEELREETGDPESRLEAKAYLMAGYYVENGKRVKSYDYKMVKIAAEKALPIANMMRIVEQVNITCNIHKDRNVVRGVDKSPECRFQKCKYKCFQKPFEERDYSTYDVYFSDDEVNDVISILIELFSLTTRSNMEEILDHCKSRKEGVRDIIVQKALTKIIVDKIPFPNCYGFKSYLYEDEAGFHCAREYTSSDRKNSSLWYNTAMVGKNERYLLDYFYEQSEVNIERIKRVINNAGTTEALHSYLRKLTKTERVILLENIWRHKYLALEPKLTKMEKEVIDFYKHYAFKIPVITEEQYEKGSRSRKGDINITKMRPDQLDKIYREIEDRSDELFVNVHTLYSINESSQANTSFPDYYNANVGNTLRIFDSADRSWRTYSVEELETALGYVRASIHHKLAYEIGEHRCYSIVIRGEMDKILIRSTMKSGHISLKGKACASLSPAEFAICSESLKKVRKEIPVQYAAIDDSGNKSQYRCDSLLSVLVKLDRQIIIS